MNKGNSTFFEMTGVVEVQHDKGIDRETLREHAKRSFLFVPTIITGDTKTFSLLRGEVKARKISSDDAPPPLKLPVRPNYNENKTVAVAVNVKKAKKKVEPAKPKKIVKAKAKATKKIKKKTRK